MSHTTTVGAADGFLDPLTLELLQRVVLEQQICPRCQVAKSPEVFEELKTCAPCRAEERETETRVRQARRARGQSGIDASRAPFLSEEMARAEAGMRGPRAREIALGLRDDPARPGGAALFS